jgi:hypothetical protein
MEKGKDKKGSNYYGLSAGVVGHYRKGAFGRAPFPAVAALAVAVLVKQIPWGS